MLDTLLVGVVAVHLLAVNVATAGPFVALWLWFRQRRAKDLLCGETARMLVRHSIWGLLIATLFGLVAWCLVANMYPGPYMHAVGMLPVRRYAFGVSELVFSLACLVGYLALAKRRNNAGLAGGWGEATLLILAGTNFVYHFPPLFAALAVLSTRSEIWGQQASFVRLLIDAEALARTIHFLLASVAVTGAWLLVCALRREHLDHGSAAWQRMAVWGAWLALLPTTLQLLAGVALIAVLPDASRDSLLGQDLLATTLFAASLLATVGLLHRLTAVAFGDMTRTGMTVAVVLILIVVVLMVGARHRARLAEKEFLRKSHLSIPDDVPVA